MRGRNVLYSMGFDAFGLPAEQYAVETGQHPAITTDENIANMRRQLHRLGLSHDKRRSISTTDPAYYRWTQWIFRTIFESWYDVDADKARPISELIDEFASGRRRLEIAAVADRENLVRVSVSDTGLGIAPEIAKQLFQPFVTTKRKGMGLGLSICRTIIEAHGGKIWGESEGVGMGSTFRVELPAVT